MTKLLYVEDNDDNVLMRKMRLELLGDFEVLTAEDGDSKCPSWTAGKLRGGSRAIRKPARSPSLPSPRTALAGEREKAHAAECNEFDTKSIAFDRLVAALRRVLAHRK